MFGDMFGVTSKQLQEAHAATATQILALGLLLIEKGIITDDEFSRAHTQATHIVDQIVAQKQEEADDEFDKAHPGVRKMFGLFTGGSHGS